jgi:hypothetical protein
MIRPVLSLLACLVWAALALCACDLLPGFEAAPPHVVPLPTYGTGRPPLATRQPGTLLPQNTRAPTLTVDPNFWASGSWISGWWWIRDASFQDSANWWVDIPSGAGDITLNLSVLATAKASGGRGANAVFYLSYGPSLGAPVYGRKVMELPNISPASDPVGYTCSGALTLTRAEIRNASRLWLKASRKDDLGEFPPVTVHLAFNKQSIVVEK